MKLLSIIILASCFFIPSLTFADTPISGEIISDAYWTKGASPYIVSDDVLIGEGVTLTIEPGTRVIFNDESSLLIFGTILTLGEELEQVFFELSSEAIFPYGIYIYESSNSKFSYANFSDTLGINLYSSEVLFDHIKITNSEEGFNLYGQSSTTMQYIDLDTEIAAVSLYEGSSAEIKDSNFSTSANDYTLSMFEGSMMDLDNVTIETLSGTAIGIFGNLARINNLVLKGQFYDGIQIFPDYILGEEIPALVSIDHSTINSFSDNGIVSHGSNLEITNSLISVNDNGIVLYEPSVPTTIDIHSNTIAGNENGLLVFGDDESMIVNAQNNWWGDKSGPNSDENPNGIGDAILAFQANVNFIPWLRVPPGEEEICCSSVVFLPGLEASRLYKQGAIFENQLWVPNRNADVEKLYLDADGISIDPDIYTRDIVDEAFVFNVYKSFIENMDDMVETETIAEWKPFPYDWRFDVNEIVSNDVKLENDTTYNMITEIERIALDSITGKVTIISHSNGGLVAKALIQKLEELGREDIVDKLILVASPQIGTPQAIAGLLHGDKADLPFVLSKEVARELGENMLGAYGLLPSEKYFETVENPVIVFDSSVSKIKNWIEEYGDSISDSLTLSDFIQGIRDGRAEPVASNTDGPNVLKENLLNIAKNTHENLDLWTVPGNIEVTEIAGWGIPTLSGIKYVSKEECSPSITPCYLVDVLDREPIVTKDGDSTVVTPSSISSNYPKYYVNLEDYNEGIQTNRDHKNILEIESVSNIIKNLILNTDENLTEHVSKTKPESSNNLELSVHSPVSIDVYDDLGNHTGIIQNPDPTSDIQIIEENIPNSVYMNFGEGKYVWLDPETSYTVSLKGTGIGAFTFKSKNTDGTENLLFEDVPVTTNTLAEININAESSTSTLKIDIDGNGVVDANISSNQPINPVAYLELMKIIVQSMDIGNNIKKDIIKKIDKIILALKKNKNDKVIEKINKFGKLLESKAKKTPPKWHKEKITKEEANEIINMLNNLLDNLSKK